MNEHEQDPLELELRRLRPAAPPPDLAQRLVAARPCRRAPARRAGEAALSWPALLRWLIPATAVVVALTIWQGTFLRPTGSKNGSNPQTVSAVRADDVEIGQELVSSFDTVARLPSGEPVRFRCMEWLDEVVVRDKDRGLTIEQRSPRVEVVPVRFETY